MRVATAFTPVTCERRTARSIATIRLSTIPRTSRSCPPATRPAPISTSSATPDVRSSLSQGLLPCYPGSVFVDFLYELRKRGVKVGPQEALALSDALALELHDTTLDGFYDVARALLVHREQDLDAFDTAFASYFEGIEIEALKLTEELLEWLADAAPRRELTDEERELLEKIDLK